MLCCACIDQSERGVKQCNGRLDKVVDPGCTCYVWPCQKVSAVNMKVQQLNVKTDTKTSDDVTVAVHSAVQWAVGPEAIDSFYFTVSTPERQITAFVDDIVRSQLPTRTLDEAFAEKDAMGKACEEQLRHELAQSFGISVVRVLITDLQPCAKVMAAMNAINSAKRERIAARERAEAQKTLTVVQAEAERDARQLAGKGLALMRREIASGFKNSITDLTGERSEPDLTAQSVVHMMLVTQYLDVLKDFAASGKSSMVVPHGAGFVQDIESQVRGGFWSAQELQQHPEGGRAVPALPLQQPQPCAKAP
eukprot:TRINITY_DN60429_c0_g1_i1.p1 TRINITY_DN60429_c0_g1~~TRINITY_DN60429_c0_g1_i1.p1  ORF type:complete len:307 (+),score=120.51 TRINITY_DN60429_c0_g1_i1:61-981(+)